MKVLICRRCKFCQGFGVKTTKRQYDKWQAIFNRALDKVINRGAKKAILKITLAEIIRMIGKKNLPDCSWCDGTGVFCKEEPDVDVDKVDDGFFETA